MPCSSAFAQAVNFQARRASPERPNLFFSSLVSVKHTSSLRREREKGSGENQKMQKKKRGVKRELILVVLLLLEEE